MKAEIAFLILCVLQLVWARSHGVRRDDICNDVPSDTLVIKEDDESCGTFIACVGKVAQRFKCLSDSVYNDGSSVCLSCDENQDDYYDDGTYKKATKKRFTYKPTKRTKTTTKNKYDRSIKLPASSENQFCYLIIL